MMPAQQVPQYPMEYNPPQYITAPQRRSLETAATPLGRSVEDIAAIARYPHYMEQYPTNFDQAHYVYEHHAPRASVGSGHSPGHHHHSSSTGSGHHTENLYPSSALDPVYAPEMLAHAPTHYTSSLPPYSFHPNIDVNVNLDSVYHAATPNYNHPRMNPENYSPFSCPADRLTPTSVSASSTRSNPTSMSPSLSPIEYPSRVPAEHLISSPPAHDYFPPQFLLASSRDSPSSSTPTATLSNSATHHRTHHSMTSFPGGPADSDATSSIAMAHQSNSQPPITSISCISNSGSSRSRHAHHGSLTSSYSPYSPPRTSTSLSSLDTPRPHVCEICQAAFHRNHDLKRHKDVHKDTKPYVCECNRAFTRKDALKRHKFLKNCGKDKADDSA